MGVTWTQEQQKVIRLRDRNILVSAAAGSGKTAVLVERIITMLTAEESAVGVDQLLIVTFTEAAAAEMKDRIRAAIEKKLEQQPENEHLKTQATLIHNAQITTIHSFCLSVIRDHFPAIDLDPGFRIREEGELKLLRHDVLGELLEECYTEGAQEFLDFVSAYGGGKNDKKLEELILKIYEFSRSYPDPQEWLENCVKAYEVEDEKELEESAFVERIRKNTEYYLKDTCELLEQGLEVCAQEDGPVVYSDVLSSDIQMIQKLADCESFDALCNHMRGITWKRLPPNRSKTSSQEKAEYVRNLRDEVKSLLGDVISQYFYQDTAEILSDLKLCKTHIQMLVCLVDRFSQMFEEKKREKDMIDFSDMEQYALRILTEKKDGGFVPSQIAKEYQKQYVQIMIDEYQDSNLIQETILNSVSTVWEGKYNIFMVGDVKQSIYRFRLSRPELFMEKFETYSMEDSEKQRIDLHKNFRSRGEVLDTANFVFRQIMTRNLGGIAYDEKAALYAGADYPAQPQAGTEILVADMEEESGGDGGALTEKEMEARTIAARIRELIRTYTVFDKGTGKMRPCRYSDIVILTRSVKGFADVFAEVLNREGIPAYAGTREGYFASQEIGILLDYLRVIDNVQQDIPLAAVLASAFGGMSGEELAEIKADGRGESFYEAVENYRTDGENETVKKKLNACLEQMDRIRRRVPYTPIHELLRMILRDTGYGEFMSAMPAGEQRRANLEMLSEKARAFEATSYKGLFHFIRYVEQLQKYDVDYGEAALEDEQANTVRIMTIHKSKGLEFPVVFVSGLGKRFNMQDARSSTVIHAGLGIGLDAIDLENRTKSPSIVKKVIQKEEALDSLGEELRVLYVALTRAKEKLILTGTVSDFSKKMERFAPVKMSKKDTLSFSRLSKASGYWDWILPAVVRATPDVPISIQTVTATDLVKEEVEEETAGKITQSVLDSWDRERIYDPEIRRFLENQFMYRYPYSESRSQKLKFTVSELKKRGARQEAYSEEAPDANGELLYQEPEIVPLIPSFLKDADEPKGAFRGTAYHRALQLIDFTKSYTVHTLKEELRSLSEEQKLPEEMLACIRAEELLAVLNSPLGERMKICAFTNRLKKEQPFVLGVDAKEIYPQEQSGEILLVQGIIDVWFEEEDGIVVLDYKTDRVSGQEELAERYHAQLDYYARALEQITQKTVKEKIIYSFALGKEIRLL